MNAEMSARAERLRFLGLGGLLLALLATGMLALSRPVPGPPVAGSPEVTFTTMMISHHAQAVEMAERVRPRSPQRTLRSLALDIALSQREQLRTMHGWLTLWGQPEGPPPTPEHARMMGMATPAELASLQTLPVPEAERTFLRLMIRHHQGALEMVRPVLGPGIHPEVARLARQIAATQRGEIRTMEALLARLGGTEPSPPEPLPGEPVPSEHRH